MKLLNRLLGRRYFISFVEEFIFDQRYDKFIGGRVEVYTYGPYAIIEIRYFTPRVDEFRKLQDRWDCKNVTYKQMRLLEDKIGLDFWEEA